MAVVRPLSWMGYWTLAWLGMAALGSAQQMPPSEHIFPATTKVYVSVPDVPKLMQAWERAPLGRLLDDPAMQDFRMDLERQLDDKAGQVENRLGIAPADVKGLPTGEVAIALIALPNGRAAVAGLIDVTNNLQAAGQTLQKIDASLMRNGAKRTMHQSKFAKAPLTHYQIPPKGKRKQVTHAVYFIENGVLGVFDDLATAEDILSRLAAPNPNSLANVPNYKAVMDRSEKQVPGFDPHLRWWIDPLPAAEAVETYLTQKPSRDPVK
ncbi:MAG TPA: hypothetical protein VHV77_11305, partial [Pirellulales bacterium]|nr:hypothetical protein [Pirellulales bacterium]